MLFNSLEFVYFFLITTILYFVLPFSARWVLLLVSSYFFYMCWGWECGILLVMQTVVNYACGLGISGSSSSAWRRAFLAVAVLASLGMLAYYKYLDFLNDSLRQVLASFGVDYGVSHLAIVLPVGLSFFTFQALGYTIDVYRSRVAAEKHPGYLALFVAFYPQLLAGPIGRAPSLLSQFHGEHHLDIGRLSAGLKMMLWGLFKKVVVADRLAVYVSMVYGHPTDHSGATLLLATYCFAFQIYCDFSGYSDIAIGCAHVLGYDLMQNFRLPYLATSISDFWSRWHISLSTWFKDYLYLPLGGNRVTPRRWTFNIVTVFLVSGLWHGASWTFVVWGAVHGFYYLIGRSTPGFRSKLKEALGIRGRVAHVLQILVTFHLVLIAWVFFRARSLGDAVHILGRIAGDLGGALDLGSSYVATAVTLLLVLILVAVQILQMRGVLSLYFSRSLVPVPVRWAGYLALIFAILYLGMSRNAFIYFQF